MNVGTLETVRKALYSSPVISSLIAFFGFWDRNPENWLFTDSNRPAVSNLWASSCLTYPRLGSQVCHWLIIRVLVIQAQHPFMWVWGSKLSFSCLYHKPFMDCAISPVPQEPFLLTRKGSEMTLNKRLNERQDWKVFRRKRKGCFSLSPCAWSCDWS